MRILTITILIMSLFSKLFGGEEPEPKKEQAKDFPPVPEWKPEIVMPMEKVIDRFRYYTDENRTSSFSSTAPA